MKNLLKYLFISVACLIVSSCNSCGNNKLYDLESTATVKGENHYLVEDEGRMFSGNLSVKLGTSDDPEYPYTGYVFFYKDGEPLPYDDEYGYDFDFLYFLSIYEFAPWRSYKYEGLSKEGREKCTVYLREAPFKDNVIVDGIDVTEWLNAAYYNAEGKKDDWNWVLPETRYGSTTFYARKLNLIGCRDIIKIERSTEDGVRFRATSRYEN